MIATFQETEEAAKTEDTASADLAHRRFTVEEFLSLTDIDGDENFYENYELINGKIVAKRKINGPSGRHGEVISNLDFALKAFVRQQPFEQQGRTFATSPCTIGTDDYLIPDLSFVAAGRITEKDFSGVIPVVPDLVAEVNSPTDTIEQIHDKVEIYKQVGVRLIWSINLLDKYVIIHQPGNLPSFLTLGDELDGGEILFGFRLKIDELFA